MAGDTKDDAGEAFVEFGTAAVVVCPVAELGPITDAADLSAEGGAMKMGATPPWAPATPDIGASADGGSQAPIMGMATQDGPQLGETLVTSSSCEGILMMGW